MQNKSRQDLFHNVTFVVEITMAHKICTSALYPITFTLNVQLCIRSSKNLAAPRVVQISNNGTLKISLKPIARFTCVSDNNLINYLIITFFCGNLISRKSQTEANFARLKKNWQKRSKFREKTGSFRIGANTLQFYIAIFCNDIYRTMTKTKRKKTDWKTG